MPTARRGLPIIDGAADYVNTGDDVINDITEQMDLEDVIYVTGVAASRPPASVGTPYKTGVIFEATDTGEVSWSRGHEWVALSNPTLTVDGAANVGTLRTLGTGALQAAAGNDPRFGALAVAVASYAAGDYINPPYLATDVDESDVGTAYYARLLVPRTCTIDRIAVQVTDPSNGGVSAVVRLGLYTDVNGRPATLVVDGGTTPATSTGTKTVVISQAITQGYYWTCIQLGGSGGGHIQLRGLTGTPDFPGTGPGTRFNGAKATSSGALPGTAPTVTMSSLTIPFAAVRVA